LLSAMQERPDDKPHEPTGPLADNLRKGRVLLRKGGIVVQDPVMREPVSTQFFLLFPAFREITGKFASFGPFPTTITAL